MVYGVAQSRTRLKRLGSSNSNILRVCFLVTQRVKNSPAKQEIQVQSLGQEDHLEKVVATHSSILCLENPIDRGAWQATVHGVTKSQTQLSN